MAADRVDLTDGRARGQQGSADSALVVQAEPRPGQGEERRAAAGHQRQHEVVGGQSGHQLQHAPGAADASFVGQGVRGLDHLDPLAGKAVAVARHREAGERAVPVLLDRPGHGRGGLAEGDHHRPSLRRRRQVRGRADERVDCSEGGLEQPVEEIPL